jgi:hypothetical protein
MYGKLQEGDRLFLGDTGSYRLKSESDRTASAISAQKVGYLVFVELAGHCNFELLTGEFGCE